jgi:mono/diheme cytochrome c family protein
MRLNKLFPAIIAAMTSLPLLAAVRGEQPPAADVRVPESKAANPSKPPAYTASRGQLLYENHCTRCHASTLHVRQARHADSVKALQGWVIRWSDEEKLKWSEEEIADVVEYLDRRYYKFPPPAGK